MSDAQEERVSCSVLMKRVYDLYNPEGDEQKLESFTAGFWCGQAEKVYLGACKAAMFRPNFEKRPEAIDTIKKVVSVYGLVWHVLPTSYGDELWIMRPQHLQEVLDVLLCREDSPTWHERRARLCGIPEEEIDVNFHLRRGRKVYLES